MSFDISSSVEVDRILVDDPEDVVDYLFKLNDGRLCVTMIYSKNMYIFKYINKTFELQFKIPDLKHNNKLIQLKNGLVVFPTKDKNINLIKILEKSYKIKDTIMFDNKKFEKSIIFNTFLELINNQIAVLVSDGFDYKKILIFNNNNNIKHYELLSIIEVNDDSCFYDIIEIPKMNQIAYYHERGLNFYDNKKYKLKKSLKNYFCSRWYNAIALYKDNYLILGSMYSSCNKGEKNFYLVKCSSYEIIDSFRSKELDYMFCTSMKILDDNSILCGFHSEDSFSSLAHIEIVDEKIKLKGVRRISDEDYDMEINGIEQYDNFFVSGNGQNLLIYQFISLNEDYNESTKKKKKIC